MAETFTLIALLWIIQRISILLVFRKGVKKALLQAVEDCSCYPDSRCGNLRTELGAFHGFSKEHIICGNGAADLIFQIVQVIRPGRALLIAPSFLEYEQALETVSAEIVWYNFKRD